MPQEGVQVKLFVSFIEIYQDSVRDLLSNRSAAAASKPFKSTGSSSSGGGGTSASSNCHNNSSGTCCGSGSGSGGQGSSSNSRATGGSGSGGNSSRHVVATSSLHRTGSGSTIHRTGSGGLGGSGCSSPKGQALGGGDAVLTVRDPGGDKDVIIAGMQEVLVSDGGSVTGRRDAKRLVCAFGQFGLRLPCLLSLVVNKGL